VLKDRRDVRGRFRGEADPRKGPGLNPIAPRSAASFGLFFAAAVSSETRLGPIRHNVFLAFAPPDLHLCLLL
jgi:hypothetical protein